MFFFWQKQSSLAPTPSLLTSQFEFILCLERLLADQGCFFTLSNTSLSSLLLGAGMGWRYEQPPRNLQWLFLRKNRQGFGCLAEHVFWLHWVSWVWKCLQIELNLQWPYWWNLHTGCASASIFTFSFLSDERLGVLLLKQLCPPYSFRCCYDNSVGFSAETIFFCQGNIRWVCAFLQNSDSLLLFFFTTRFYCIYCILSGSTVSTVYCQVLLYILSTDRFYCIYCILPGSTVSTVSHTVSTVCHTVSTVCHTVSTQCAMQSLHSVPYSLYTVCHTVSTVCHAVSTVWHTVSTVCHTLSKVCHTVSTVCHTVYTVYWTFLPCSSSVNNWALGWRQLCLRSAWWDIGWGKKVNKWADVPVSSRLVKYLDLDLIFSLTVILCVFRAASGFWQVCST